MDLHVRHTFKIRVQTSFYHDELSQNLRCQRRQGNEKVLQPLRPKTELKPGSHMSATIDELLSVIIQTENSQRIYS